MRWPARPIRPAETEEPGPAAGWLGRQKGTAASAEAPAPAQALHWRRHSAEAPGPARGSAGRGRVQHSTTLWTESAARQVAGQRRRGGQRLAQHSTAGPPPLPNGLRLPAGTCRAGPRRRTHTRRAVARESAAAARKLVQALPPHPQRQRHARVTAPPPCTCRRGAPHDRGATASAGHAAACAAAHSYARSAPALAEPAARGAETYRQRHGEPQPRASPRSSAHLCHRRRWPPGAQPRQHPRALRQQAACATRGIEIEGGGAVRDPDTAHRCGSADVRPPRSTRHSPAAPTRAASARPRRALLAAMAQVRGVRPSKPGRK